VGGWFDDLSCTENRYEVIYLIYEMLSLEGSRMSSIRSFLERGPLEASAPCRVDMGGTLDLSTFYLPLHHLGPCTFNVALDLRTRVTIRPFDKGRIGIRSRGFEELVVDSHNAPFHHPLGLMLAVVAYFQADGVHVDICSASPPRSALGGSSVAAVALIWAFSKALVMAGKPLPDRSDVAVLAHAIEQSVAGVPCGMQDQLAAVFGGVNGWHWKADPSSRPFERQILVPSSDCKFFSRHMMVAYCGVPHVSKDINGSWVRQFAAGHNRDAWQCIIDCSKQFISAIADGNYQAAQSLMNRETDLRRQLTPEVLDDMGTALVAAARQNRCGARFTGAGGGGCLWALGEPEQIERLRPMWAEILGRRESARILETQVDTLGLL
jgi:D-glycero-alpha-D-manno-heptose-7-phosphate kinase